MHTQIAIAIYSFEILKVYIWYVAMHTYFVCKLLNTISNGFSLNNNNNCFETVYFCNYIIKVKKLQLKQCVVYF